MLDTRMCHLAHGCLSECLLITTTAVGLLACTRSGHRILKQRLLLERQLIWCLLQQSLHMQVLASWLLLLQHAAKHLG